MAEADLSKVISLIMENPSLVEQIRNMVNSSEKVAESPKEKTAEPQTALPSVDDDTYSDSGTARRNELLRAIRPYLSEERGKAIESMITISDILSIAKKEK